MDYKAINTTEIKANVETGIIEGYASWFNNKDSHNDIIMQGAFSKTIRENKKRVKVLWQHDTWEPIGVPLEMSEDLKGLYTKSKISETDIGKKTLILARDGVLSEMSIGYDTIIHEYDNVNKIRYLKELKLWEYSMVTFASNPMARITDVKELMKEYQYSKGNVFDIIAIKVAEQLKALLESKEPDDSTLGLKKPQDINDIDPAQVQSILEEIRKYK